MLPNIVSLLFSLKFYIDQFLHFYVSTGVLGFKVGGITLRFLAA